MINLDMIGKPCPIPVIEAKKALAKASTVVLQVDNFVAVQNLGKMAKGLGYEISHTEDSKSHYTVTIQRQGGIATDKPVVISREKSTQNGATVLITKNKMGEGDDKLGEILLKGFVYSLTELSPPPKHVLFLNGGVKLTSSGSSTLDDLEKLEQLGTSISSCGTCLDFYQLTDKLMVGNVVNMYDITLAITLAEHLITI